MTGLTPTQHHPDAYLKKGRWAGEENELAPKPPSPSYLTSVLRRGSMERCDWSSWVGPAAPRRPAHPTRILLRLHWAPQHLTAPTRLNNHSYANC